MPAARERLETLYGGPQKKALRTATDNGLEFVPRLVRGPVKKVLFGDPGKAIDVAKRLSPGFLADATVERDPRRLAAMAALSDEAMLRTAFVLEHKDALDQLSPARLGPFADEVAALDAANA